MSLKTNRDKLVMTAVQGTVSPANQGAPFEGGAHGEVFAWPSTGGITYNVKVGDSVFGWVGEHIEPGVSAKLTHANKKAEAGFQFLSCCGNEVRVVSGEAKGEKGTVIGHHGGVEHLMLDFPDDTLDRLTCDDKFLIRGYGQGLKLVDYPDVYIYNLAPDLFEAWGLREGGDGALRVPVHLLAAYPSVPSAETGLVAFAVVVATGAVFGLYPALRASRLDPVVALRSE